MIDKRLVFSYKLGDSVACFVLYTSLIAIYLIDYDKPGHFLICKRLLSFLLIYDLAWMLVSRLSGYDSRNLIKSKRNTYQSTVKCLVVVVCLFWLITPGLKTEEAYDTNKLVLFRSLILCGLFLLEWNVIFLFIAKNNFYASNKGDVVVEGEGQEERDTSVFFLKAPRTAYKNTIFFDDSRSGITSGRNEPLENAFNRFVKRVFDIVFALIIIVFVLSWLFPVISILIVLESEGGVFFTQMRTGRNNKPFRCFKFRSMKVNKSADLIQATRDDDRVTTIGAFIRKTSLDELPQFFNVLLGEMSVVGPRPHMVAHTEIYSKLIDGFMVRHFLKPGITGWAQVNGLRGETKTVDAMLQRVESDVWYLENWSFLLDLKIIFLTVRNSAKGEENAF